MKKLEKLESFYAGFITANPDVKLSGKFDRAELIAYSNDYGVPIPSFVWENKISRGVYAVPNEYFNQADAGSEDGVAIPTQATVPVPKIMTPHIKVFVPAKDSTFVPFGAFKEVEDIIDSNIFYPVYVTGLSGNGKSMMIEQICAKHRREMIRVNLNALSDEEQLVGSKTLREGNVEIVEGPVLIAMRTGAILLIDEIDAGSANSLLCLQSILEGKPYYFKLKNELIVPTKGFNIIATANTKGKGNDDGQYIGTNILNEAFLERFGVTFEQEYPSQKVELRIILNMMEKLNCTDESFASCLSKWADAIRRTYEAGGVDEIMSTRRIVHIVTAFSIFKNKKKAVELCCNRFDTQTKQAFIDMFSAVSPDETVVIPRLLLDPIEIANMMFDK